VTTVGGKGAGRVKRSSVKMELGDVKVGGAEVKQGMSAQLIAAYAL
jgi:hypothetical protein